MRFFFTKPSTKQDKFFITKEIILSRQYTAEFPIENSMKVYSDVYVAHKHIRDIFLE